jgi:hypothetical protein
MENRTNMTLPIHLLLSQQLILLRATTQTYTQTQTATLSNKFCKLPCKHGFRAVYAEFLSCIFLQKTYKVFILKIKWIFCSIGFSLCRHRLKPMLQIKTNLVSV